VQNKVPSVYLVAGNRLLREALVKLLSRRGIFNVCSVSSWAPDTASLVGASGADVLILDSLTALPSNCAFITEIVTQYPSIKVILIDMDSDLEIFLACAHAGAVGYVLKDASAAEVVFAVELVARGHGFCPPQLCIHLFQAFSRQCAPIPGARMKVDFELTRRQRQILPLISEGLTNKEIASHLNLSEQTVKNHIHGIMRRVGAGDRLDVLEKTRLLGYSDNFGSAIRTTLPTPSGPKAYRATVRKTIMNQAV
jgi:DNA-binding NarL/FixJ family response regulator